ncbi:MAG: RNA polymerase sigma factor [Planctomycetes bacterium]|nr:RNA polymerase sigma factor [Planctomycetota bacterium]MCW8137221.1 RNA polymerase sigma factor [Planctomycetota bacterium]
MSAAWNIRLTDTTVALATPARDRGVALSNARDHAEFEQLVHAHFARGVRFCSRLLGDANEGEEVAQAAFVKIYESGRKPWQQGDPLPWLYRVLRNACVDHVRRRRVRRADGELAQAASTPDLSRAERTEVHQAVMEALQRLDEDQKQAVLLRFFEELSLPQTAQALERSVGATAMLLTRAKARLKELLGKLPEIRGEA